MAVGLLLVSGKPHPAGFRRLEVRCLWRKSRSRTGSRRRYLLQPHRLPHPLAPRPLRTIAWSSRSLSLLLLFRVLSSVLSLPLLLIRMRRRPSLRPHPSTSLQVRRLALALVTPRHRTGAARTRRQGVLPPNPNSPSLPLLLPNSHKPTTRRRLLRRELQLAEGLNSRPPPQPERETLPTRGGGGHFRDRHLVIR